MTDYIRSAWKGKREVHLHACLLKENYYGVLIVNNIHLPLYAKIILCNNTLLVIQGKPLFFYSISTIFKFSSRATAQFISGYTLIHICYLNIINYNARKVILVLLQYIAVHFQLNALIWFAPILLCLLQLYPEEESYYIVCIICVHSFS